MIMLVDNRRFPRETYYVCPHCERRIDVILEEGSLKFSCHSQKARRESKSSQLRSEKELLIKALHDFVAELEGQRGKKLTDEEATASIKIVKGVISSLQAGGGFIATSSGDEEDILCSEDRTLLSL